MGTWAHPYCEIKGSPLLTRLDPIPLMWPLGKNLRAKLAANTAAILRTSNRRLCCDTWSHVRIHIQASITTKLGLLQAPSTYDMFLSFFPRRSKLSQTGDQRTIPKRPPGTISRIVTRAVTSEGRRKCLCDAILKC